MWYKEAQGNVSIPAEYAIPAADTTIVHQINLENRQSGHRKQYTIRVYSYDDGMYSVIAYHGRINGSGLAQPKGMYRSESSALSAANNIKNAKTNRGYRDVGDLQRLNISLGGVRSREPAHPSQPSQPSRPTDGIFTSRDVITASPEQMRTALLDPSVSYVIKRAIVTNNNITPEILEEYIFSPVRKDGTSLADAIHNSKTSPETIERILRRGAVSGWEAAVYAASSNKASKETIDWILGLNVNNPVTFSAAANPIADPFMVELWKIKNDPEGSTKNIPRIIDFISSITEDSSPEMLIKVVDVLDAIPSKTFINNLSFDYVNKIQDIVERIFNSEDKANYFMSKFPETFFDHIGMKPEHREMVSKYFDKDTATNDQSYGFEMMEDIFSKNKSWYKRSIRSK